MKTNPNYIKVLLDKNAIIVEFHCTLRDVNINSDDVLGKNWFDTFIDATDKEEVFKKFTELLDEDIKGITTHVNDILVCNSQHRFIHFTNEVITVNNEKYISSFGVENMDILRY